MAYYRYGCCQPLGALHFSRKVSRRVALYLRVSTFEQTTENQRCELQAVAEKAG